MKDLLETLEGGAQHQPESNNSNNSGLVNSTMESNEWAWEQALVDI